MWRGEVSIIIESRNIEDLQRIYRHIIPLLKTFGKSNFQNKSSSWNIVCSSLESEEGSCRYVKPVQSEDIRSLWRRCLRISSADTRDACEQLKVDQTIRG